VSLAELLARGRVSPNNSKAKNQKSDYNQGSAARSDAIEQAAVLRLAIFAALSVAVYYLAFVRPYSLQHMWMSHQLDLDRLAPNDPAARWYILGGIVAAMLLYYLAWRTVSQLRSSPIAWVIVIGGAIASGAVLLYFYPLGSTDIWDYIIHGRMLALHHANPFVQVAANYPGDVFAWYAGWPFATSAYGPFWEVLAAATASLVPGPNIIQGVVAFKILVGVFLLASVGVVAMILRRVAPERALLGAFLLAWNPVVLYETLGNGHNDIVMVFWMLAAIHMLIDRRYTLGILALIAGALVKFIPLLMIPAAGLIALRDLPNWRDRAIFLVTTTIAGCALIFVAYQPFWVGPQVLSVARREAMYTSSLPAAIVIYLWPKLGWAVAAARISKIAATLTAIYAVYEGFRAMSDRSWHSFTRSAFSICMFYLLLTCLWFWDWYAVWPLALAAVLPSGHATRLAQIFGVAALSKPLVFGPLYQSFTPLPSEAWQQLRQGPSIMALPWIYCLYIFWDKILTKAQQRWDPSKRAAPAYAAVPSGEAYSRRERDEH
jgi:hypothetical protein